MKYKIPNTTYSIRKQGLTLEEKYERELNIYRYKLDLYFRKFTGRRKDEYADLPSHIYKCKNTGKYILDVNFMNIKRRVVNHALDILVTEREKIRELMNVNIEKEVAKIK